MALALTGADREEANAYLKDQRALIADQRHHLHRQFKHFDLSIWEKRLAFCCAWPRRFVGLAVAAGSPS